MRRMTSFTACTTIMMLVGSLLVAPAQAGGRPPGPPDPAQIFDSLAEAVEAGVVEPRLADLLRAGKPVPVLAVFSAPDAERTFADGNPAALERAQILLRGPLDLIIRDLDLRVDKTFSLLPVLLTPLSNQEAALRLINHKLVASLWVNGQLELWLNKSLPLIGHTMFSTVSGLTGAGAAVAILDTGADTAVVSNVLTSVEIAPDDGSLDDDGHGTKVAAVIAAVAPGADLIPIDITNGLALWHSDILSGLNWVLLHLFQFNIRVVNLSLGRDDFHTSSCGNIPTPYNSPFSMLRQAKALPIVAAGNHAFRSGSFQQGVSFPACVPGAVAVGASYTSTSGTAEIWPGCTDQPPVAVDTPVCASGSGPRLDIFAPGSNIVAGGKVGNGTSIAAPHVSGAAVILATINPAASAAALQSQLTYSTVQITDPRTGQIRPRLHLPDTIRAAAPVPNDNRAQATLLTNWSGNAQQTTWTATKEPGELLHAGNDGGSSIWYRWLPSQSAYVDISTKGSDFDTLLAVYGRDAYGNSILLGQNDNAGTSPTSFVTVHVNAGDVIDIAIDGIRFPGVLWAAAGHARLSWNLPSDNIADALDIAPAPGVVNVGSNVTATKQNGEPAHCGDTYSNASSWYRWTPTVNQTVRLRASGAELLCAAVYQASATIPVPTFIQLIGVNSASDDQGPPIDFTFAATPSETYWIAFDGVSREYACNPNTGQCAYVTPTGAFSFRLE